MKVHKAYKFRIYPTNEQKVLLAKHFGSCRFVYNHYLNNNKELYQKEEKYSNYNDNAKLLTSLKKDEEFKWLKEVNSQSLQFSIKCLDVSFKKFFKKLTKFPKFKSKYDKQSFTVPKRVGIRNSKLIIRKFKEGIKINIAREIEGKILFATISKTKTDKYFASITCETVHIPSEKTGSTIGIDTGIKNLAILSDGKIYK